jgi:hypothetical protein
MLQLTFPGHRILDYYFAINMAEQVVSDSGAEMSQLDIRRAWYIK